MGGVIVKLLSYTRQPIYVGDLQNVKGLKGDIEIKRDKNGVPHIYADCLDVIFQFC